MHVVSSECYTALLTWSPNTYTAVYVCSFTQTGIYMHPFQDFNYCVKQSYTLQCTLEHIVGKYSTRVDGITHKNEEHTLYV